MVSLSYVWFLTTSRKLKIASSQNIRLIKKSKTQKLDSKKEKEQKRTKRRQPIKIEYFDKLKSAISHAPFYFFVSSVQSRVDLKIWSVDISVRPDPRIFNWVVLKRTYWYFWFIFSESFTTNFSCKLNIFWHYRYSFSMNSTEICVFKKTYQIGFGCFLKCHHCRRLESQILSKVLSDFSD